MILECRNLNKSFVNKKAVIDFNIKMSILNATLF